MRGAARDAADHERLVGADPTYLAWMIEHGMVDEWPMAWTRKSAWITRGKAQHEIFTRQFNAAMQRMVVVAEIPVKGKIPGYVARDGRWR